MRGDARRITALLRRDGRSPAPHGGGGGGGSVAPTITAAPVLTWTVEIGETPTLTDPVYTGDPGTITWTLYRDGVADGTIVDVDKATAEAYAAQWSGTNTGVNDIGNAGGVVPLVFRATVTNGAGSDSADSNAVSFNDATYLADNTIAAAVGTLVLADSDTTVDSWDSDWGGVAITVAAADASRRPAYSASGGVGGRPRITGDGTTDSLFGTKTIGSGLPTLNARELGFVGAFTASSTKTAVAMVTGGSNQASIGRLTTNLQAFIRNTAITTAAASYEGSDHHFDTFGDGSSIDAEIDGASIGSVAAGATSLSAGTVTFYVFSYTGSQFFDGHIDAWHFGAKMTADQRLHARALLTGLTGIAC